MSFFHPVAGTGIIQCSTQAFRSQLMLHERRASSVVFARFKSKSARPPPKSSKPAAQSASKPAGVDNTTSKREESAKIDSTRRASLVLNSLRKSMRQAAAAAAQQKAASKHLATTVPVQKEATVQPVPGAKPATHVSNRIRNAREYLKAEYKPKGRSTEDGVTLRIDQKEQAIQRRIAFMRRKLLWPGIWTLFALTGTYGLLAYLDVKAGVPSSDGSQLPERIQVPQTWYLTPTVIREGIRAYWKDLDNLTIGIVIATFAIHLLRKSPLPIWEKLIHVTGEAKWTAFTYPLVNSSWQHAVQNMTVLAWFLPSVVRYFDGDLFHTSAFLISVPLITSYFTHFAYRFNLASGLVLNLGASGAAAAAFGVYVVSYAHDKLWMPPGLVFRFDTMYWGLIFAAQQAYKLSQSPRGGNRPAYLIHLASLGLGMAYAYFDMKHHLWIPLVSELSSTQESEPAPEG